MQTLSAVTSLQGVARAHRIRLALVRLVLSVTFLTAALAKALSFGEFKSTLGVSELLPNAAIPAAAAAIIALEALTAAGLVLPRFRHAATHSALVLSSSFVTYSVWRWSQGISAPCKCFGFLFRLSPAQTLLVDLVLLSLVFVLLTSPPRNASSLTLRSAETGQ